MVMFSLADRILVPARSLKARDADIGENAAKLF